MMPIDSPTGSPISNIDEKRKELRGFLFLSVLLAPLLSVVLVGGYGFAIWMIQIIAGPPGAGQ